MILQVNKKKKEKRFQGKKETLREKPKRLSSPMLQLEKKMKQWRSI